MAYTKIVPIRSHLDKRIRYILRPEKTTDDSDVRYTGAFNCAAETAYHRMLRTQQQYQKETGVRGYHIIQSFPAGEVGPELAHSIATTFIQRYLASRYEVVYATHVDRGHTHNHIIFSSVSFVDGLKYHSNAAEYFGQIRRISDELCREHGLSIILENRGTQGERIPRGMSYREWVEQRSGGLTWKEIVRQDIDSAILRSLSYGDFLTQMENMGYTIKQGKHVAFRPDGKERFVRGYILGEEYSEDAIRDRILHQGEDWIRVGVPLHRPHRSRVHATHPQSIRLRGWRASYYRYLYQLGKIRKHPPRNPIEAHLRQELQRYERFRRQFEFLLFHAIETPSDLALYRQRALEENARLTQQAADLQRRRDAMREPRTAMLCYQRMKPAHELYEQGHTSMQRENDAYLQAEQRLRNLGYDTPERIESLERQRGALNQEAADIQRIMRANKQGIAHCDDILTDANTLREQLRRWDEFNRQQGIRTRPRRRTWNGARPAHHATRR